MTYNPEYKAREIARYKLKLHLASKGYPSARVTDNRAHYYLRRMDHDSNRSISRPAPENLASSHKRASLVVQALLIWGAVAWAVWFLVA